MMKFFDETFDFFEKGLVEERDTNAKNVKLR